MMFLNTCFSPAETLLAGSAGAGRMVPPASTRISARMKRVHGHVSPVNMHATLLGFLDDIIYIYTLCPYRVAVLLHALNSIDDI